MANPNENNPTLIAIGPQHHGQNGTPGIIDSANHPTSSTNYGLDWRAITPTEIRLMIFKQAHPQRVIDLRLVDSNNSNTGPLRITLSKFAEPSNYSTWDNEDVPVIGWACGLLGEFRDKFVRFRLTIPIQLHGEGVSGLKQNGISTWVHQACDTLLFNGHYMRQFQLSNENWLDPQSCPNIQNVAVAVGDKIMFSNFRVVAEYVMHHFPALKHLRVIWGRCSESLVETKEQPENLRFVDINKDFQDMEISNSPKDSNENSLERDHFSRAANSMQRYYSDIIIPLNPRYWEVVKFEVQMMACYRQGNSKAQTEPALWIETFDCRVPCDSKGRLLQTQQGQPL